MQFKENETCDKNNCGKEMSQEFTLWGKYIWLQGSEECRDSQIE